MSKGQHVHAHDSIHWFLADLCSRVVAKSGVPNDIYHLGKIILQSFIDAPDFVNLIDGATDEEETNASVMDRSIRCAIAFRKLGFVTNDVITIMAPNHLDVAIPFYAALYLGLPIASVDVNLGVMDLEAAFRVNRPKLILCQSEKSSNIQIALKNCNFDATVITFDKSESFLHFQNLLETHGGDENAVKEFNGNNVSKLSHMSDAAHWYLSELTSRIVAKSGIPDDRYHLGKIILQNLIDDPEFVVQIDGATGESENFGSVLKRSVQCANGLRKLGLKTGDVMILMAPNHLDLTIPFYAALYLGITIAPIDPLLRVNELEHTFRINKPKVIFCQNEKIHEILEATKVLDEKPEVITFDKGDQVLSFADFLDKYGNDVSVEDFRPADFSPRTTIAILLSTSGTTGKPKSAAVTHRGYMITLPYFWLRFTTFPTPTRMAVILSPIQWLSAIIHVMGAPVLKYTRLQSSKPMTQEHAYFLFNKYRPSFVLLSPSMMSTLIKPGDRDKCDFSCFETIIIAGGAIYRNFMEELKEAIPTAYISEIYGLSETTTITHNINSPTGSCGKPYGLFQCRLVDPITGEDVNEPNVPGELWVKSPALFAGYYNDPEATAAIYEDGWLKSGDILYRDEDWNLYFVDRLKLLLKYRNHQISPVEVEGVIREHPAVMDVAVVGLPDPECGELPVACVVPKPGHTIVAQEIKDLVKNTLADSKQLRGGVVVMSELPLTATTKLHRQKLNQMVLTAKRE